MEDHFINEVDAFTAPESSQEAQQASLQSLIALMKQGSPSALQLVSTFMAQGMASCMLRMNAYQACRRAHRYGFEHACRSRVWAPL